MHVETSFHGVWVNVQGQLQLAPQQQHAMRAVHETMGSNLAQLLSERKALVDRLQVLPGCPMLSRILSRLLVSMYPTGLEYSPCQGCRLQTHNRTYRFSMATAANLSYHSSVQPVRGVGTA